MMKLLVRLALVALCLFATVTIGRMLGLAAPDPAVAESAPKLMVRIAARDLAAGTFLDASKAPFAEWPGAPSDQLVQQGTAPERDVMGAVLIAPIAAGQPITRAKLLMPGQDGFLAAALAPGMRAASVAVDAVSGNAGLIFPGDRVDLILTQSLPRTSADEGLAERWASETILENVRVIAVDQRLTADPAKRDTAPVARTVTLEVSPRDAEKVALASGLGRLSLSLRSLIVTPEAQAQPAPGGEEAASRGPTWASDVSAVIRSASGRPEPTATAPAEAAPSPAPTRVRVFRGSKLEEPDSP